MGKTKKYIKVKIGKWKKFIRKGDFAIYLQCTCGYYYDCSEFNAKTFESQIRYVYNYCPMCGRRNYLKGVKK